MVSLWCIGNMIVFLVVGAMINMFFGDWDYREQFRCGWILFYTGLLLSVTIHWLQDSSEQNPIEFLLTTRPIIISLFIDVTFNLLFSLLTEIIPSISGLSTELFFFLVWISFSIACYNLMRRQYRMELLRIKNQLLKNELEEREYVEDSRYTYMINFVTNG